MLPAIKNVTLEVIRSNKEFTVAIVPPTALPILWPMVKEWLQKDVTLWDKGQSLESLKFMIEAGELHLWVVTHNEVIYMSFLTEWKYYPQAKSLKVVWGMGHELEKYILIALSALESYVQRYGAKFVEIDGRDGWAKPLKPFGYVKTQTTFVKEVNIERLQ